MNKLFKTVFNSILSREKAYLTSLTGKDKIESLIYKLHPILPGKELIRLGPKGDGGYLVPDNLKGIEACFSPGVSDISGFEKDCAKRGVKVFLADKSVERPPDTHGLFSFTKKYVGAMANNDFITIDDWVETGALSPNSDLMLQMDIEGYEYETFFNISDTLMGRFRIIVAEFHYLDQLWNHFFFHFASRVFEKILQTHACVHIHPNNYYMPVKKDGLSIPPLMEFTFLRQDWVESESYSNVYPHSLDCDNTDNSFFPLPECWYRK